MRCLLLLLVVAVANAFVAPLSGSHMVASRALTSSPMTMKLGGSSNRGIPKSLQSFARRVFSGKISSRKGGNGINGGGKTPPPPFGPLGASAAGDADKKGDNPFKALWAGYNNNLDKHPIVTKALTSFIGFGLGDFLAQKFINKADKIDYERLARMASFGLLIHGPTGHYFYGFLDSKIPGTAALTVAKKVFIDQIIWNPIFGCMFFGYMGATEGLKPAAIKTRIEKNLWSSVRGSWTVWPVAHAINFKFVPTSQRLLYINSIQIGYNMFLSILSQRAQKSTVAEPEPLKKGKKAAKNAVNSAKRK